MRIDNSSMNVMMCNMNEWQFQAQSIGVSITMAQQGVTVQQVDCLCADAEKPEVFL